MYIYIYICIYICAYVDVDVDVDVDVYVCVCVCIFIYSFICLFIHFKYGLYNILTFIFICYNSTSKPNSNSSGPHSILLRPSLPGQALSIKLPREDGRTVRVGCLSGSGHFLGPKGTF